MDRLRDGLLERLRKNPKAEMPFLDHLEELRWRILWSLLALVVGTGIGMFLVQYYEVDVLLMNPLREIYGEDYKLTNLAPLHSFYVLLYLSFTVGLVLASPVIFYQVWVFLAPALEKREKRAIIPALWMGLILFLGGVAMAYFIALPLSLRWLGNIMSDTLDPNYTGNFYFGYVVRLHLGFGAIFEMPVVVLVLSALGLITPSFLRSKRRHAIVGNLVVASIISPGDMILLTAGMMIPMVALYEFSIVLSVLMWRRRRRRESGLEEAEPPSDSVAVDTPGPVPPGATPYDHGDPAASADPSADPSGPDGEE